MRNTASRYLVLATLALTAPSLEPAFALAPPAIKLDTRRVLPLTASVTGAALGDFDEDGRVDIVANVDGNPPGVQIFRGLGSGRYAFEAFVATPGRPYETVAADFNGDGHTDLAITGTGPALTILLGNGAGGFGAPVTYGTTQRSDDLATADFNEDGHPDIALTHAFTDTVSVFLGTGTGAFGPEQSITIPATSSSGVETGDFKVDGHVDIAVGAAGVTVLPGNGAGGFGTPVPNAGLPSSGMTARDVDDDGLTDLVTANPTTGAVQILGSAGNGTFSLKGSFPVTAGIDALALGDLNGDGRADAVAGGTGDQVYVLLATGPGMFGSAAPFRAGSLPDTLIVADLDQDGRADVLAGNTTGREVAILPGNGLGRLAAETSVPLTWSQTPDVAAADFNEDGLADIAALNSNGPFITQCGGGGAPTSAGGASATARVATIGAVGDPITAGPLDCDPLGGRMLLTFVQGTGHMTFGQRIDAPTRCAPVAMAVADFNQDGHLDVATANQGARDAFGVCTPASLSLLAGNGQGNFSTLLDFVVDDVPDDIAVGDFNEDGIPDLVVSYRDGLSVRVYRGAAGGAIIPVSVLFLPSRPRELAVGDLNSDGHLDVAVVLPDNGQVAILRGDGTGQLVPIAQCAPDSGGGAPVSVAIGDFDGDGSVDIAAVVRSSVTVMHRSGTAFCVAPSEPVAIPAGASRVIAGDLDADGIPDLLAGNNNQRLSVARGAAPLQSTDVDAFGAYYSQAIATADFDDDGLLDVAVTSSVAQSVSVVRNVTPVAPGMLLSLDGPMIEWTGTVGATGYDIVRGSLRTLRSTQGDFTAAVEACVADDVAGTSMMFGDDPGPGETWWFLGRPILAGGPGSYDIADPGQVGSSDAEIAASPLACP